MYRQNRQTRVNRRVRAGTLPPTLGNLGQSDDGGILSNWGDKLWSFGQDVYKLKQREDIAAEQTEQMRQQAQTELEKLKTQRALAQSREEQKRLDADIQRARMQMIQEVLIKGVPVILAGGGLIWYLRQKG